MDEELNVVDATSEPATQELTDAPGNLPAGIDARIGGAEVERAEQDGGWAGMCRRFGRENLLVLIVINGTNGASLFGITQFLLQYYLMYDVGLGPAEAQFYFSLAIFGWALKPLFGTCTDLVPASWFPPVAAAEKAGWIESDLKFKPYLGISSGLATLGLLITGLLGQGDLAAGMTGVAFLSVGTAWSDLLVNAYSVRVAKLDRDNLPNASGVVMALGAGSFSGAGALAIPILAVSYGLLGTATVPFVITALAQATQFMAIRWIHEQPALRGQSPIKLAWKAMDPSGPSEGVVLKSLLFLVMGMAIVPDTSQAIFAFYTAADEPEWSVANTDDSDITYDCAFVGEQLKLYGSNDCSSAIPTLDTIVTITSDEGGGAGGGERRLWVDALYHCPTTCDQCASTSRGCLGWDPSFLAIITFLGCVASAVGAGVYDKYLGELPLRQVLFLTCVLQPLASLTDVVLVNHWNVGLGINDHFFGGLVTMVKSLVLTMYSVATYALVGKICPESVEATLFSWVM
eukprot:SAG31_NODE_4314_length_3365_cov_2.309247_2_plen_516_part_00